MAKDKKQDTLQRALGGDLTMVRALKEFADPAGGALPDKAAWQAKYQQLLQAHPEYANVPASALPSEGHIDMGFGKKIGGLAKIASKIAGFIPGVGAIPGAILGAGGSLLSGEGIKGALKNAALGAIPGVAKGLVKGATGAGGLKGLISGAVSKLGGPGAPGSKGSLIGQLATAVPGVIGAVQGMKARSQANKLLGQQAAEGQSLLAGARPLRTTAQSMILNRLTQPGGFSFGSDRLNPFSRAYGGGAAPASAPAAAPAAGAAPAETDEERRKRLLLAAGSGVPPAPNYLAAAGVR